MVLALAAAAPPAPQQAEAIVLCNGGDAAITDIAVSRHGQSVLAGSADGRLRVWCVPTRERMVTINAHDAPVSHVRFLVHRPGWLSADGTGCVRAWCARTCACLGTLHVGAGDIECVSALDASGRVLVLVECGYVSKAVVWNIETGEYSETCSAPRDGNERATVGSAVVTPDGEWSFCLREGSVVYAWLGREAVAAALATEKDAPELRCHDPARGRLVLCGHTSTVRHAMASVDRRIVVSVSDDGVVRAWRTDTGECVCESRAHGAAVSAIQEAAVPCNDDEDDGGDAVPHRWRIASGDDAGVVCVFDVELSAE